MALLERVATLIRANLNDLVDKAEDPEKMLKQVILDMQNQLVQVKTQVAVSIADEHVLEKRLLENEENERNWRKRAELAVDKGDDALARTALERALSFQGLATNFRQQVEDQKLQVENLKTALLKLQQKLEEAEAKSQVLLAQHRRSRALGKATDATSTLTEDSHSAAFDRMKDKVVHGEALAQAKSELMVDDVEGQFASMEKSEHIERLLDELKASRRPPRS
jgi:phage shock protein A